VRAALRLLLKADDGFAVRANARCPDDPVEAISPFAWRRRPLGCLRRTTKTVEKRECWRSSRSETLPRQRPSPGMSALALAAHDAPVKASGRRYTLLKVGHQARRK
jgi:hypothetical protein